MTAKSIQPIKCISTHIDCYSMHINNILSFIKEFSWGIEMKNGTPLQWANCKTHFKTESKNWKKLLSKFRFTKWIKISRNYLQKNWTFCRFQQRFFRVASKMRFVHFINIQKMSFDLSILQNGLGYINATVTQLMLRALRFRAENSKVFQ